MLKTTLGTLLLAACAGLGGCAAPALSIPYVYASEVVPVPLGFTVEDRRPPSESESEMLSYNVANDLYGITRLGNAQIIPDRVPYLVARLKERAGNRLSGGKMTIEHFTVHLNKQAAYRKFAVGVALGGIVGHVIQSNLDPSRPFIDTELRLTIERRWCPRVSASTWAAGRSKRRWRWPSRRRSTRRLATSARSSAGRRAYTTAGRHRPSGSPIGCLRQYGRTHFCGRLRILSCQACISPKPVSSLHTWFSNHGCAIAHQSPIRIKAWTPCGAKPLAASAAPENRLFPAVSS